MEGLSNLYIDRFLRSYNLPSYFGIYSSNNIPPLFHLQTEACLIVNLSPVDTPGTHFTAILKQNEQYYLADSLGLQWNNLPQVIQMQLPRNVIILYPIPLQSFLSSFCGFYGIFFILHFNTRGETLNLVPFSTQENNDSICLHNIHKMLKYISPLTYMYYKLTLFTL